MVANRTQIIFLAGLLFACSTYIIHAESRDLNHSRKPDYERGERITGRLTARIESEDYTTPFRTVETLIKALSEGNLNVYLECLTEESRKSAMGGKDLSPDEIQQLSDKAQEAEFKKSIIHTFYVNLDANPTQVELVISSLRENTRIIERLKSSIIETEEGWKLDKPTTDTLTYEQIKTDSSSEFK